MMRYCLPVTFGFKKYCCWLTFKPAFWAAAKIVAFELAAGLPALFTHEYVVVKSLVESCAVLRTSSIMLTSPLAITGEAEMTCTLSTTSASLFETILLMSLAWICAFECASLTDEFVMMAEVELNESSVAKESTAAITMMSRIGRAALLGTKSFFPLEVARFFEIPIHYFGKRKSRFQLISVLTKLFQ